MCEFVSFCCVLKSIILVQNFTFNTINKNNRRNSNWVSKRLHDLLVFSLFSYFLFFFCCCSFCILFYALPLNTLLSFLFVFFFQFALLKKRKKKTPSVRLVGEISINVEFVPSQAVELIKQYAAIVCVYTCEWTHATRMYFICNESEEHYTNRYRSHTMDLIHLRIRIFGARVNKIKFQWKLTLKLFLKWQFFVTQAK